MRLVHRQHHVTADGDVLVCDTDRAVVHTVRGVHAASMRQVIDHAAPDLDLPDDDVTLDLVTAGLLARCAPDTDHDGGPLEARPAALATDAPHTSTAVDRRRFLGLSATAAAGITTLALPTAAHAASHELPPSPPATTTTVALPAAPSGGPSVTRSTSTRNIRVTWVSSPEAFTYQWIVYSNDDELIERASGTAISGALPVVIYTMPAGVVKFRVTTTSNTSPAATHTTNLTF